MKFIDRLLTIIITATLTSAIWIIAGGSILEMMDDEPAADAPMPVEPALD
ncbi:MAG: hypothetical protein ABJP34_10420 [Erythrobacter sp.]